MCPTTPLQKTLASHSSVSTQQHMTWVLWRHALPLQAMQAPATSSTVSITVMGQPHKIVVIEIHLLGRTLLVSQLVTSITRYLYPWIFVHHGYGSSTNPHFIEVHLLGCTLSVSQLVTRITGYICPQIFVHHGYESSTNPQFIEDHLLGRTLSVSQLVTSITGYLYPWIFVHHGYGLTA